MTANRAEFFRTLFGDQLPKGLSVHARLLADVDDLSSNRGLKGRSTRTLWFESIEHLLDYKFPEDMNCYFGVGLRQPNQTPPVLWTALFADLDTEPSGDIDPPPSVVVRSGRGHHLYWLLRTPVFASEGIDLKPYLRGIMRRIGADPNAAEPARILRIPGTMNVKRETPELCEVVEIHVDRRYDLTDFSTEEVADNTPADGGFIDPEPMASIEDAIFPKNLAWLKAAAWSGLGAVPVHKYAHWDDTSHSALVWRVAEALCLGGQTQGQAKWWMQQQTGEGGLIRDEERRRPTDKIDRAIRFAWAKVAKEQEAREQAAGAGLIEHEGELYLRHPKTGKRDKKVANFTVRPLTMLNKPGAEGGGYWVQLTHKDGYRETRQLPMSAFRGPADWRHHVSPGFEWRGTGAELVNLHMYLNAMNPVKKEPTELLGWHGAGGRFDYLLAKNGVFMATGVATHSPVEYVGNHEWSLVPPPADWQAQVARVLDLLLRVHEPHVVWTLLGWTMSTFLAPHLRRARGGTPTTLGEWSGLWVWGEQGSGKSGTVRQFLRLTATPFLEVAPETTLVGLQRFLASSNTVPVFIDDPRQRLNRDTDTTKLYGVLRGVFNGMDVGLADVSDRRSTTNTIRRKLQAPVLVASEHAIEHDDAMEERYLYVPFKVRGLESSDGTAFSALTKESTVALALGFYQFFWNADIAAVWAEKQTRVRALGIKGATSRRQDALAQILVGLEMAKSVAPSLPLPVDEEVAETIWWTAAKARGRDYGSPASEEFNRLLDLIHSLIATRRLQLGVAWKKKGDALYVARAQLEFEFDRLPETGGLVFTPSVLTRILQTHEDKFVRLVQERFPGENENVLSCIEFDLAAIRKELGRAGGAWNQTFSEVVV